MTHLAAAAKAFRTLITKQGIGDTSEAALDEAVQRESPMELAILQAVYEMAWTSSLAGFDEDHHTSSFMGHLATNLRWYTLMARWTALNKKVESATPEIFWAQQSLAAESKNGADFGLALCERPGRLRLALFQAKCATNGTASIVRGPKDGSKKAAADRQLLEYFDGKADSPATRSASHQLYKLLQTEKQGRLLAAKEAQVQASAEPDYQCWVHYVFWRLGNDGDENATVAMPTIRCIWQVADEVDNNRRRRNPLALTADDQTIAAVGASYVEVLAAGLRYNGHDCCLEVSVETAVVLLGHVALLNPDTPMIIVDETGSGSGAALCQGLANEGFTSARAQSPAIFAEPPVPPPPPPPQPQQFQAVKQRGPR